MKDRKSNREVANALVMVLQLGINIIVPIFLCMIAGGFLAKMLQKDSGAFITVGMLIGIVAAFNGTYRSMKKYLKNEESPGQRARRLEEEEESHNKSEVEHD